LSESVITISIVGLIAGIIFSMPIAGPISILITSNALKGRLRYCHRATIGASFADFVFVVIAVFGLTSLYSLYKPFIPYVLFIGAVFLFYLGYKISRTVLDLEHLPESQLPGKLKVSEHGGFFTGFFISFLNPTLFLGWMSSSFFIISFVASLGFNTGGLNERVNTSIKEINQIEKTSPKKSESSTQFQQLDSTTLATKAVEKKEEGDFSKNNPLLLSVFYAFFLAVGSIIWFYLLAYFLARFRHRINKNIIQRIIRGLGIVLCLFGLVFLYKGIRMF
jgi:threonine/homoserine/homoserine lactone efflux protein